MSHEEYVAMRAREALQTIQEAKDGAVGLLLAVREVKEKLAGTPDLKKEIRESDVEFLVAVCSECDELPLGSERQYWAAGSLREKDLLAQSYEEKIREDALSVSLELPMI
jgi:hypothetical protein